MDLGEKPALTCILNGRAGSNEAEQARDLIERLATEYDRPARVVLWTGEEDLPSLAEQAREAGGMVVAGGGDGTISTVAGALVDTGVTLGVLPLGTLNHFAKDLGIPLEIEAAARTLFTGKVTSVDVGEVNGRIFLNNSSIGFYPRIVRERERLRKQGHSKWIALARASGRIFKRSRTLRVELADGDNSGRQTYDTPFVFVGNNRYALSGAEIGTRAALDGGELWVCAAPSAGRFKLLGLAVKALFGWVGTADLPSFDSHEVSVRMRRSRIDVATDGEVTAMRTPLTYRIRPGALRVLVPSDAAPSNLAEQV
jgi:diacylglycerol kinase family enzyme